MGDLTRIFSQVRKLGAQELLSLSLDQQPNVRGRAWNVIEAWYFLASVNHCSALGRNGINESKMSIMCLEECFGRDYRFGMKEDTNWMATNVLVTWLYDLKEVWACSHSHSNLVCREALLSKADVCGRSMC